MNMITLDEHPDKGKHWILYFWYIFFGIIIFILMALTKGDFITIFRHCYLNLTRVMGGREYYTSLHKYFIII